MDCEWYRVENLKKSYQEQVKRYEEEGVVDSTGDFGSYLAMLNNGTDDLIQSHNAMGIEAKVKAMAIIKYLKDSKASLDNI